ncbi:MAG: site-specific DNA-methyltransferase [bacterium]|nr:site-specific DNA-methyltransferase [bacterium]
MTLILGDCREVLKQIPEGAVDLVLTDPPYGMNYQSQRVAVEKRFAPCLNDAELPDVIKLLNDISAELYFCLCPDGHFYCFAPTQNWPEFNEVLGDDFDLKNTLVYLKGRGTGDLHGGSYTPGWEALLFYTKKDLGGAWSPPRKLNGHPCDVLKARRPAERIHPMQKALDVCEQLIENSTQPGEIVLDPFAGSGTTGAAARLCDSGPRKAILIEKDPDCYAAALARLRCHGPVVTEMPQ